MQVQRVRVSDCQKFDQTTSMHRKIQRLHVPIRSLGPITRGACLVKCTNPGPLNPLASPQTRSCCPAVPLHLPHIHTPRILPLTMFKRVERRIRKKEKEEELEFSRRRMKRLQEEEAERAQAKVREELARQRREEEERKAKDIEA